MKAFKKISILLLLSILLGVSYFQWFYDPCANENTKWFIKKSSRPEYNVVIANEESHFKDSITQILVRHYEHKSVQVKVIPISLLPMIEPKDYSAVVIIHSLYTWRSPPEVAHFLKNQIACSDKIVVFTTSSNGTYKMDNVDAITGASRIKEVTMYADKIIVKLNPLLGLE